MWIWGAFIILPRGRGSQVTPTALGNMGRDPEVNQHSRKDWEDADNTYF